MFFFASKSTLTSKEEMKCALMVKRQRNRKKKINNNFCCRPRTNERYRLPNIENIFLLKLKLKTAKKNKQIKYMRNSTQYIVIKIWLLDRIKEVEKSF